MRIGALEAGGTKMVCAVGDETGAVFARMQIPTAAPEETVPAMIDWFRAQEIEALGIGCFGPIPKHTVISPPHRNPAGPGMIWWEHFSARCVCRWDLIRMSTLPFSAR